MLRREDAQKILDEERTPDWQALCLSAIQHDLPEPLRPAAYALLNYDEQGNAPPSFYARFDDQQAAQRHYDSVERGFAALAALDAADRQAVFAALVPRLAPALEAVWQLNGRLPYQLDWRRKAFRAPGNDTTAFIVRKAWLRAIMDQLASYRDKDLPWFAAWATYMGSYGSNRPFGILFAAAIDEGGPEGEAVFDVLVASANGTHPIGGMGRHVTTGLLVASRPDGWACIERLLLAAQREEGLRQVILETIDEAHPQAFRRMLRLLLDHDLFRFNAAVRAVDVWFGFGWTVDDTRAIREAISAVLSLLDDPDGRRAAIARGNPQEVYFALWATAFENAFSAIVEAGPALTDALPERRLAAVHLLGQLGLAEAQEALLPFLDDVDLRVALSAFHSLVDTAAHDDLFECLERLLGRVGQGGKEAQSNIWPWLVVSATPQDITRAMVQCLGQRSPERLIAYMPQMDTWTRLDVAEELANLSAWSEEVRLVLYELVGDRNHWVRERALKLVVRRPLDEEGALALEQFLTRKSSALRRGLMEVLLARDDEAVLGSARRLLSASHPLQRQAGLDLLNGLVTGRRVVEESCQEVRSYQSRREALTSEEAVIIDTILAASQVTEVPTQANVLGLIKPEDLTPRVPPCHRAVNRDMTTARKCLHSLDALIAEYRTTPIMVNTWRGTEEMLLGNVGGYISYPDPARPAEVDRLPLLEVWRKWERERPAELRDEDGLELLRARMLLNRASIIWRSITDNEKLEYPNIVDSILTWLLWLQGQSRTALEFLFTIVEDALAAVSIEELEQERAREQEGEPVYNDVRTRASSRGHLDLLQQYRGWYASSWAPEDHVRYWQILHWLDEPIPGISRRRPPLETVLAAYRADGATEADILEQLGGCGEQRYSHWGNNDLRMLSGRKPHPLVQEYPVLQPLVTALRERILEIELARGEMATVATRLALSLRYSGGLVVFVRLVAALAPTSLARGYVYDNEGRGTTFSHLLRVTYPGPEDTPEEFARWAGHARLPQENLVAAALYAPQWAAHVEHYLAWPHFEDAVWWIYAHTKDSAWSVEEELREEWRARVAERTPLTAEELLSGAVDVAWFWRCYRGLGEERWEQVYAAAKYASSGSGHGRARLFADAMLGRVSAQELRQRMFAKRSQDVVRALGLVPLPADDAEREAEIAERYAAFQEFKRSGRKFGAQRRGNEEIAINIGLENLARSAGYPDPVRLQWAMEARTASDLRNGALIVEEDGVQVTLALSASTGEAQLTVTKSGGKVLKALPAKLKKHPDVVALLERKREIERQVARMRGSLEDAMCRGDRFTVAELCALLAHPVLARLLQNLIFVCAEDENSRVLGYPLLDSDGASRQLLFRDYDGVVTAPSGAMDDLRLAHPYDLLKSGAWHSWQHECFVAERIQPFKQVFRELYTCTGSEMGNGDGTLSLRYSGHQVQPTQARALLGQRGWVGDYYEGGCHRTLHQEGITAFVTFQNAIFTPAEVGHLTIEDVHFYRRGAQGLIPLTSVPPRIFSEVMRDLDLVVSVAHSGGVDPEATASTVEMRAALAAETCALLGLTNVAFKSAHVIIEGTLGSYSVHLGSAIVHRQPGGALCIVPVHAQQRGRIFLPFASDDPKTAEVITKIVTLARDQDIKDPTILEQLR